MSVTPRASWKRPRGKRNSLTMLQNAETAVGKEVLHTCRPTKYVSVFPVMGIPRICVRVILGISHRYGTKSGKINPYLYFWGRKIMINIWCLCLSVKRKSYAGDLRARREMPMVIWGPSCGSDEQNDWYLQPKRNETSGKQVGSKLLGAQSSFKHST